MRQALLWAQHPAVSRGRIPPSWHRLGLTAMEVGKERPGQLCPASRVGREGHAAEGRLTKEQSRYWRRTTPGRGSSRCKGPEAGTPPCGALDSSKEASVAGVEGAWQPPVCRGQRAERGGACGWKGAEAPAGAPGAPSSARRPAAAVPGRDREHQQWLLSRGWRCCR